jgi:FKBP-type peptidyl-prolyl cis-trans isomerase 2
VVGMKPGDSKTTEVPVEKAFGLYLEERVVGVPKNTFARWGPEPVTDDVSCGRKRKPLEGGM